MTDSSRMQAIDTVQFYTDLGNELFNTNMRTPSVVFSLNGKCGGTYSTRNHVININSVLMGENMGEYIEQTIPHEVAHAFQRHIYGGYRYGKRVMPHGKEWKSIMTSFGKEPMRCHDMDTSNSTCRTVGRDYQYRCNCRTFNFTAIRHRRSMKGTKYTCLICHSRFEYVGLNG